MLCRLPFIGFGYRIEGCGFLERILESRVHLRFARLRERANSESRYRLQSTHQVRRLFETRQVGSLGELV